MKRCGNTSPVLPERKRSRDRLRRKIEMLSAHLKRNLNFRRLRLRGMRAREECTLAAVAQNLPKARQADWLLAPEPKRTCARNHLSVEFEAVETASPFQNPLGGTKREPWPTFFDHGATRSSNDSSLLIFHS
jgi:hypothetical protein